MTKKILLTLTIIATMCFAPCLLATASARIELSEIEAQQQVKIEQKGNSIVVSGAAGKTVLIYNLIGVKVMSVKIDAPEKRIDLSNLDRGIYPVKVGNVSKKIHVSGR